MEKFLILILFVVTALIVYFICFAIYRWGNKPQSYIKTNYDSCLNEKGIVVEEICNLKGIGLVKLKGQSWSAKSYTGEDIPLNTIVSIKGIDGVKLVVEPVPNENENKTKIIKKER